MKNPTPVSVGGSILDETPINIIPIAIIIKDIIKTFFIGMVLIYFVNRPILYFMQIILKFRFGNAFP